MIGLAEVMDEECACEYVHVYPTFGKEHDLEHGLECWCHPFVDEETPDLIIHNVPH